MQTMRKVLDIGLIKIKRNSMVYFIVGLVCFIAGFCVVALIKSNVNIGFGQNITMIDGEIINKKK